MPYTSTLGLHNLAINFRFFEVYHTGLPLSPDNTGYPVKNSQKITDTVKPVGDF